MKIKKPPVDPNGVLEQLSKMVCVFARAHNLDIAVAVTIEMPSGKTAFSAFGNTDKATTHELFAHAAHVVSTTEPAGHFEHKVVQPRHMS